MTIIKDVKLTNASTPAHVPAEGFYADLRYMYGDANGYNTVTAGPFPSNWKHLFIEFLNVLEGMLALYPDGKGGWDGYEDVPGYLDWFNDEGTDDEDGPDARFREGIGLETECVPDGSGCIASFRGYECYYHDGVSMDRHEVSVVH